MIRELTNHIWQSTILALLAAVLSLAFRRNRASVRYWLWLSASLKFLLPFSLLMGIGSRVVWPTATQRVELTPGVVATMIGISQPFSDSMPFAPPKPGLRASSTTVVAGLWACGFMTIVLLRARGWRGIQAAVRASGPISIVGTVRTRSSPGLLEPGVVGLFRPVLLLPADLLQRLRPAQAEAILAHELCHVRRRDNLTAAIHMIVEAVFWFHPVVWWIGARLMEERERACDEEVLRLGNKRRDYAEAILDVCKSYVESPLRLVSGVTGSNLKKRIEVILTGDAPIGLTLPWKLVLAMTATTAIGLPVIVGATQIGAHAVQSAGQSSGVVAKRFETAAIKPCEAFRPRRVPESPGRLESGCTTLQRLMQEAYGVYANGNVNPLSLVTITGGPAWTDSDLYEIDAKADDTEGQVSMKGPMLQAILEDRFRLKIHRENRNVPVYRLTANQDGSRLQPFHGNCIPWDYDHPNPGPQQCATATPTQNGAEMKGWTMADICYFLLVTLDRPVIDETGMAGRFDFRLELAPEMAQDLRHGSRGAPSRTDLAAITNDPALVSAIKSWVIQEGLKLEPTETRAEFVVIDHAEKPAEN